MAVLYFCMAQWFPLAPSSTFEVVDKTSQCCLAERFSSLWLSALTMVYGPDLVQFRQLRLSCSWVLWVVCSQDASTDF